MALANGCQFVTDYCAFYGVLKHLKRLLISQLFYVSTITYLTFESILNVVLCDPCYCGVYHFVKKCIHNYELYSFKCYILSNIINIMSLF